MSASDGAHAPSAQRIVLRDNARLAGLAGVAALVATASALAFVLGWNAMHGDELGMWRLEYAGGGSGKFRSPDGQALQVLLLGTLWMHVTAPLAALLSLAGISGDREWRLRVLYAVTLIAALALFVVILQQSFLRPAFGITPSGFPLPDGV